MRGDLARRLATAAADFLGAALLALLEDDRPEQKREAVEQPKRGRVVRRAEKE